MSESSLHTGPKGGQFRLTAEGKKIYSKSKRVKKAKKGGSLTQHTKTNLSAFLAKMTEATRSYISQQMNFDSQVSHHFNQWERDTYRLLKGLSEHAQDEQIEWPE